MKENIWSILTSLFVLFTVGFSIFSIITLKMNAVSELPMAARENEQVREAFLFAKEQPGLLEQMPCFCGCVHMGHRHNRDCYIDDDGKWVEHGSLCGGCVGVTLDVKKLFLEGKSIKEIRSFIDNKHGTEEMADPTLTPPIQ
ncbi:MAG: PCYCGC motif-containing (lipo)protein [Nanoarchaeota archaeon]|nr:PCYCGC motif-containing (lipo)protein [Nanoarchaeota archaeon]